jgi:hypothetical protein
MWTGPAKLAYLAVVFLAAVMLLLGGAGRAEAHALPNHAAASAAHGLAAAPGTTSVALAALTFEGERSAPMRADMVSHESDTQPAAPDRSNDAPCCGGGLCHTGVVAPTPAVSPLALMGAKLPLPNGYDSASPMPSGIERPPRRPSAI